MRARLISDSRYAGEHLCPFRERGARAPVTSLRSPAPEPGGDACGVACRGPSRFSFRGMPSKTHGPPRSASVVIELNLINPLRRIRPGGVPAKIKDPRIPSVRRAQRESEDSIREGRATVNKIDVIPRYRD